MSTQLIQIHDAFFKQVLGDPELAGRFLREHLPPEVVEQIGPEMPEPLPTSLVDEELRQHHSDLMFRIHLKTGTDAFAYVLLEHKSAPNEVTRLQLIRYIERFLSKWYVQNGRHLPLPLVLPLVAHQGPGAWNFSCEFVDLFGDVPAALRPYLPTFRHALVDLSEIPDEALSTTVRLRALLKALKYGRRPELPQRLEIVLAEAGMLKRRDLQLILTYLDKGPIAVSREQLQQVLHRLNPYREERIMGWITQPYFDEGLEQGLQRGLEQGRVTGRAEGLEQGRATGRAEGLAGSLVYLLEKRFGSLPEDLRTRVLNADEQSLHAWLDRVIDAADLQSVFSASPTTNA